MTILLQLLVLDNNLQPLNQRKDQEIDMKERPVSRGLPKIQKTVTLSTQGSGNRKPIRKLDLTEGRLF